MLLFKTSEHRFDAENAGDLELRANVYVLRSVLSFEGNGAGMAEFNVIRTDSNMLIFLVLDVFLRTSIAIDISLMAYLEVEPTFDQGLHGRATI